MSSHPHLHVVPPSAPIDLEAAELAAADLLRALGADLADDGVTPIEPTG